MRHGITGDDIDYSQVAAESFAHAIGETIGNELRQPQQTETSKQLAMESESPVEPQGYFGGLNSDRAETGFDDGFATASRQANEASSQVQDSYYDGGVSEGFDLPVGGRSDIVADSSSYKPLRIPLGNKINDSNFRPENMLPTPESMRRGADFMGGIATGAGKVASELFYSGYDLGQHGVSSLYDAVTGESTHNEYLSAIGKARAAGISWGGIAYQGIKGTLQTPARFYDAVSDGNAALAGEEFFNLGSIVYPLGKGASALASKFELVDVPQRFGQAGGVGIRFGGSEASRIAQSVTNGLRLSNQLLSEEIAQGHAFGRHVLGTANGVNEFAEFGVKTRTDFANFIETIEYIPIEV